MITKKLVGTMMIALALGTTWAGVMEPSEALASRLGGPVSVPVHIRGTQSFTWPTMSFDGKLSTVRVQFSERTTMKLEIFDGQTLLFSDTVPGTFYQCTFARAGNFTVTLTNLGSGTHNGTLTVR